MPAKQQDRQQDELPNAKKSEWRRGECQCCYATRVMVIQSDKTSPEQPTRSWDLCRVCYRTYISNVVEFSKDTSAIKLARCLGGVANLLLKEIRRARKPKGRRLGLGRGTILHHDEGPTLGPEDLGDPRA